MYCFKEKCGRLAKLVIISFYQFSKSRFKYWGVIYQFSKSRLLGSHLSIFKIKIIGESFINFQNQDYWGVIYQFSKSRLLGSHLSIFKIKIIGESPVLNGGGGGGGGRGHNLVFYICLILHHILKLQAVNHTTYISLVIHINTSSQQTISCTFCSKSNG